MLGGLEFGFLSGASFQFVTLLAYHQFLSIVHDKMGQNFSLGKHILSYFVCCEINGKWKPLQPLALLYCSVQIVFGKSVII